MGSGDDKLAAFKARQAERGNVGASKSPSVTRRSAAAREEFSRIRTTQERSRDSSTSASKKRKQEEAKAAIEKREIEKALEAREFKLDQAIKDLRIGEEDKYKQQLVGGNESIQVQPLDAPRVLEQIRQKERAEAVEAMKLGDDSPIPDRIPRGGPAISLAPQSDLEPTAKAYEGAVASTVAPLVTSSSPGIRFVGGAVETFAYAPTGIPRLAKGLVTNPTATIRETVLGTAESVQRDPARGLGQLSAMVVGPKAIKSGIQTVGKLPRVTKTTTPRDILIKTEVPIVESSKSPFAGSGRGVEPPIKSVGGITKQLYPEGKTTTTFVPKYRLSGDKAPISESFRVTPDPKPTFFIGEGIKGKTTVPAYFRVSPEYLKVIQDKYTIGNIRPIKSKYGKFIEIEGPFEPKIKPSAESANIPIDFMSPSMKKQFSQGPYDYSRGFKELPEGGTIDFTSPKTPKTSYMIEYPVKMEPSTIVQIKPGPIKYGRIYETTAEPVLDVKTSPWYTPAMRSQLSKRWAISDLIKSERAELQFIPIGKPKPLLQLDPAPQKLAFPKPELALKSRPISQQAIQPFALGLSPSLIGQLKSGIPKETPTPFDKIGASPLRKPSSKTSPFVTAIPNVTVDPTSAFDLYPEDMKSPYLNEGISPTITPSPAPAPSLSQMPSPSPAPVQTLVSGSAAKPMPFLFEIPKTLPYKKKKKHLKKSTKRKFDPFEVLTENPIASPFKSVGKIK